MHLCLALLFALQKDPASTKEAMQKIQLIVGEWKGTGQPKEMKRADWIETLNTGFKIDKEKDLYQIEIEVKDGVFWKYALFGYDVKKKHYTLEITALDDARTSFTGKYVEKEKELTFDQVTEEFPRTRVSFSLLRDNRYLIEFLKQEAKGKDWLTLALIGATKQGVPFVKGEGPKCVVTGGGGSMTVEYKGKAYYIC